MPSQLSLVVTNDPVDEQIAKAERRGQKISPWVRQIMRAWAVRNPKMPSTGENAGKNPHGVTCIEADMWPMPCDCTYCGEPAMIFPAEDGSDPRGYCICPCCSGSACPHKELRGRHQRMAPCAGSIS